MPSGSHRLVEQSRRRPPYWWWPWAVGATLGATVAAIVVIHQPSGSETASAVATNVNGAPIVTPSPSTPTVPKPPPGPAETFAGTGEFRVGIDIAPGTYESAGPIDDAERCVWVRERFAADPADKELQSRAVTGRAVVTIKKTDKQFRTSSCQQWRKTGG